MPRKTKPVQLTTAGIAAIAAILRYSRTNVEKILLRFEKAKKSSVTLGGFPPIIQTGTSV